MPKNPILKKLAEQRVARLKARAAKNKGKGVALLPREPEPKEQEQTDAKTGKDV